MKTTSRILKKTMAILLSVALVFTMMPMVPGAVQKVHAGTNATTLYIHDGEGENNETISETTEDAEGGWSWNAETATLTLTGFGGAYIEANGDINIVLTGENTLTLPAAPEGSQVHGIKSSGAITITDDGEGEQDSLTVQQTGFTKSQVYVYGIYASEDITIEDCHIAVNLARVNFATYPMNGLHPSGGYAYVNGSASLDIDVEEGSGSKGVVRGLYANTSGSIDIRVSDNHLDDEKIDENAEGCGGLYATGSGSINLDVENGYASTCSFSVSEGAGTITFKGAIETGTNDSYITSPKQVQIPGTKKFTIAGNPTGKTGFGHIDLGNSSQYRYGYYLLDEEGNPVTAGTLATVAENPLTFLDLEGLNAGALTVGKSWRGNYFHRLVSGGTGEYTFSISEEPGYGLPKGISLVQRRDNLQYIAYLNGTPTEECAAGVIRVIATDSAGATASIDIGYGAISNPPKNITVDGTAFTTEVDQSGAGWSYKGVTKTLNLNGYNGGTITTEEDINIVLTGENTLTLPAAPEESQVYGIKSSGAITITDDGEGEQDSLTVQQTGFTKSQVYVYGIYASEDITIEDCHIAVNLARVNFATYPMYGLHPSGGYAYVNGSASLDIDVEEGSGSKGVLRGLYADTSGAIDIRVYDNHVDDENIDETAEGCGGLYATGSGSINLDVENGYASTCSFSVSEGAGTITFKGAIETGTNDSYITSPKQVQIPGTKKFTIAGNPTGKTGFGHIDLGNSSQYRYGYYLLDEEGNPVTAGTLATVAENPLTFLDLEGLNAGALTVGKSWRGNYFHRLVSGGTGEYTFSISEEPGYGLPKGISLVQRRDNLQYIAYLNGTPTEECAAGVIRVIATDSAGATVSIDIGYGPVSVDTPITGVTIDKEEIILAVDGTETLLSEVTPEDATIKTVTWSSNNREVATVNSDTGLVTGQNPGVADITVTTTQGKMKDSCKVYVKERTPVASAESEYIEGLVANGDYTINGEAYTADASGKITILDSWRQSTINIIKVNTEPKCNSDAQQLAVGKKEAIDIATLKNQAELSQDSFKYDGEAKTPSIEIAGLILNVDYTIDYRNNTDAGTYAEVIVKAKGEDYIGSFTKYFTITAAPMSDIATITAIDYVGAYDKMGHTITINGKPSGAKVLYKTSAEDEYTSTIPTRVDAGTTTVYYRVELKNYESVEGTAKIQIKGCNLEDVELSVAPEVFTFDSMEKSPVITLTDGVYTLVKDKDYTITGDTKGTAVGTYTFTITGKGNYEGSIEKTFTINPCTHTWDAGTVTKPATCAEEGIKTFTCTVTGCGEVKTEPIAIAKDSHPKASLTVIPAKAPTCTAAGLTAGEKCSACGVITKAQQPVAALDHKAGTPNVTMKATASKAGTKVSSCTVCGTALTPTTIKPAKVTLSKTAYTYNGKVISSKNLPKVSVKTGDGKAIAAKYYTVSKPKNEKKMKAIGRYTYTVKFKSTCPEYTGTVKLHMEIKPVKVTQKAPKAAKKAVTVKWKSGKKAQVTGYEVIAATDKKLTKNTKKAAVTGYKKTSKQIKGLKARKTYYVSVRAYKTVKGVKIYSDWSAPKKIKTK